MPKVKFDYGYNLFSSKDDLKIKFFGDFYDYIKDNTDFDFSSIDVKDKNEFIKFCGNWNALGKSDLYGPGDTLNPYYLVPNAGRGILDQSSKGFVGYIYKQGKYKEFIEFLPEFFRYWRKDEGCDCFGPVDTYDFYYRAWDSLVDTLKFFYFTSETLQDKYPWFKSLRVKRALDVIPSVDYKLTKEVEVKGKYKLPILDHKGFVGWYLDDNYVNNVSEIDVIDKDIIVYALINTF